MKKRKITDFFASPGLTSINSGGTSGANISTVTSSDSRDVPEQSPGACPSQVLHVAEKKDSTSTQSFHKDNIGFAIANWREYSDMEKARLLEQPWSPPSDFEWPYTERKDGQKIRRKYLGPQHFTGLYQCFSYSTIKKGIYCKPCAVFAPSEAGGSQLERLVKSPLQKYTHLTGQNGYLSSHLKTKFHEDSLTKANTLIGLVKSRAGNIVEQMNTTAAKRKEKNRNVLRRIIQAIEFLGRLGLPLRGHHDSGILPLPNDDIGSSSSDIDHSQGNLRALLQLMVACGDKVLRDHFTEARRNATYISSNGQNDLIEPISTTFENFIVDQVKQARFFSILADETTDSSKTAQLSLCFRYIHESTICERFFYFDDMHDFSWLGIATQILNVLRRSGVDIEYMVGQGFDGAAAMSGLQNGVQKHIRDECPSAVYTHCAAHSLNLCLLKAGQVQEIRTAVTLMNQIAVFFNESTKRQDVLQTSIEEKCQETKRSRLKLHCKTRWVERQEAVMVFQELLPAIEDALEKIGLWPACGSDSAGKALIFASSLNGSFYVTLNILVAILEVTKPLSSKLQGVSQDIHNAMEEVHDCVAVLKEMRDNDSAFRGIFLMRVMYTG